MAKIEALLTQNFVLEADTIEEIEDMRTDLEVETRRLMLEDGSDVPIDRLEAMRYIGTSVLVTRAG